MGLAFFCLTFAEDCDETRYAYVYNSTTPYNGCDLNADGATDVLDIIILIGHILGQEIMEPDMQELADQNDDSSLDVLDIVMTVDIILNPPGYEISADHSAAVRFPMSPIYMNDEYYIHFVSFRLRHEPYAGQVVATVHADDGNSPGEVLISYTINLTGDTEREYYVYMTSACVGMDFDTYYWMSVGAANDTTDATWLYSQQTYFIQSVSEDGGNTWQEGNYGHGGLGRVRAEQVLNSEPFEPQEVEHFLLPDLNPNSPTYSELVGPEVYNGDISCYYFSSVT